MTRPPAGADDGTGEASGEVEALRAEVARLRRRLLALVRVVPLELLPFVVSDAPSDLDLPGDLQEVLAGLESSTTLHPGHVGAELEALWQRLPRRERT